MEWMEVLSLCLSCFSLGFSLCGFIYMSIVLLEERRRRKNEREYKKLIQELAKEERKCETCKHFEKGIEEEPCDICDEETKDKWEVRR